MIDLQKNKFTCFWTLEEAKIITETCTSAHLRANQLIKSSVLMQNYKEIT